MQHPASEQHIEAFKTLLPQSLWLPPPRFKTKRVGILVNNPSQNTRKRIDGKSKAARQQLQWMHARNKYSLGYVTHEQVVHEMGLSKGDACWTETCLGLEERLVDPVDTQNDNLVEFRLRRPQTP